MELFNVEEVVNNTPVERLSFMYKDFKENPDISHAIYLAQQCAFQAEKIGLDARSAYLNEMENHGWRINRWTSTAQSEVL